MAGRKPGEAFVPGEARHRSRLPRPQVSAVAVASRFSPSPSSLSSRTTKLTLQQASEDTISLLETKSHGINPPWWTQLENSASYHGNKSGGQARTQYGHHFGDRTNNETHVHHHYGSTSFTAHDDISNESARGSYDENEAYLTTPSSPIFLESQDDSASNTGAASIGSVFSNKEIVISGLGQYIHAIKAIPQVRHLARHFSRLKREIETEVYSVLNFVELLLKEEMREQDLWHLLDDVWNSERWRRASIDRALRKQLGRSYTPFWDSAEALDQALAELKDALMINAVGAAPFTDKSQSIRASLSGLKFGFRMKPYFELLEKVKARTAQIQKLSTDEEYSEPVSAKRRCPDFNVARLYAMSLFALLKEIFGKTCSAKHRVSLALSLPANAQINHRQTSSSAAALSLLLHHDLANEQHSLPWTLEEAELRGMGDSLKPEASGLATRIRGPKVRFQEEANDASIARGHGPGAQRPEPQTGNGEENHKERAEIVHDLCQSLKAWRVTQPESRACLGLLCDVNESRKYELYWPQNSIIAHATATETTLATAVSGRTLSLPDRRRLALALALGTLQLYDTPWFPKQWGKHEVLLFTTDGRMVVSGPFVTAGTAEESIEGRPKYFSHCTPIRNETIFALGVVLIELALKRSFEELKIPEDSEGGVLYSDFNAAVRLIKEVEFENGSRYADVVRRCVRCEFDLKDVRLDDRKLQELMYSKVVAILQEELAYFEPAEAQ